MKHEYMKYIDEVVEKENSNDNKNLLCSESFIEYARKLLGMIHKMHFPELDGFEVYENEIILGKDSLFVLGHDRNRNKIEISIDKEGMTIKDEANTLFLKISSKNMSTLSPDVEIIMHFFYNGDIVTVNKSYDNKYIVDVYTDIEAYDLNALKKWESTSDLIPDYTCVYESTSNKNLYNYNYSSSKSSPYIGNQPSFYGNKNEEWDLNFIRLGGMNFADACHKYRKGLDLRVYKKHYKKEGDI